MDVTSEMTIYRSLVSSLSKGPLLVRRKGQREDLNYVKRWSFAGKLMHVAKINTEKRF